MKSLLKISSLIYISTSTMVQDTEPCNYVGDNCPVWNGWSPKCHVSGPICNGDNCYVQACSYSAAHAFGTSTDLIAGVPGIIQRIAAHDTYNCGNP
mgnify:CR=1 FL=1|jgi:hypothetical protein